MKANIPEEFEDAAYDYTYTNLVIDVLNKKILRAESEGKEGFQKYLEGKLKIVLSEQNKRKQFMSDNGIKVSELREVDDMFCRYDYWVKGETGGYKEGFLRIWKAAIKLQLTKRLNKLLDFHKE